ncbi:hypothetical protein OAT86_01205 [Planktomarina sp.]|jgi:hypothetical protein|nr:hypothetical protein [Planktomarina sp.]
MKARGIVVIDYDLPGGYREAAIEEEKLEQAVASLVKGNPRVIYHEVDIRERRGDNKPDIKKMKLRSS